MKPLVTLSTLLLVLLIVMFESERTSPGALSAVHDQVPELKVQKNCIECHVTDGGSMSSACLACHEMIQDQISGGRGIHGQLENAAVEDCSACHGEHLGAEFMPGGNLSFMLAGFEKPEDFDHSPFDWNLTGAHDEQGCEECHANAHTEVLAIGQKRFLGLSQSCDACHDDVHEGVYGADCAGCHGQEFEFKRAANFEHNSAFPLNGSHAVVGCADCHDPETDHAIGTLLIEASERPEVVLTRDSCLDCHTDPHTPGFIDGVSNALASPLDQTCTHCHSDEHESFHDESVRMTPELHASSLFNLVGPHSELECAQCHTGFGETTDTEDYFAQAFPGRQAEQCGSCHEDPHEGSYGPRCTDCHGVNEAFDLVARFEHHPDYPLTGSHEEVACADCHEPNTSHAVSSLIGNSGDPGVIANTRQSCRDCHTDPHSTEFITEVALTLKVSEERSCAECHDILHDSFLGPSVLMTEALHSSTSFPLEPPHAELGCAECHVGFDELHEDVNYFANAFPGRERETCESCHEDPHQNQFEKSALGNDCIECHSATAFVPSQFNIERHARTQFPLTGSHTAVGCVNCHEGAPHPVYSEAPLECSACHDDPHKARFERPGLPARVEDREGCARCHTTESFEVVSEDSFDHLLWTQFELLGAHTGMECIACHRPTREERLVGRNFGLASGTSCADCHNDVHLRQFEIDLETDCARCHAPTETVFEASLFDHETDSMFLLDENHIELDCATCHLSYQASDGTQVTRYIPLGTECVDCHDPGSLDD